MLRLFPVEPNDEKLSVAITSTVASESCARLRRHKPPAVGMRGAVAELSRYVLGNWAPSRSHDGDYVRHSARVRPVSVINLTVVLLQYQFSLLFRCQCLCMFLCDVTHTVK